MYRLALTFFLASILASPANAIELSGNISIQGRSFFQDPIDPAQQNSNASFSAEPEVFFELDDEQSITFKPFLRLDQNDDERSHGDIRELYWQKVYADFELTVGINKVYWGVTETQHLVDIINQTDNLENIDGEDKLGQTMIQLSTEQDWGVLDLFVLPGFRERQFVGIEGRPRPEIPINTDLATYESDDKDSHIDYALRWFTSFGDWEVGLSHFAGTGRDPVSFQPSITSPGVFAPHYTIIHQTGLDAQVLVEDWTWKLEFINRRSSVERFSAYTAGFEYTLVGVAETSYDLGIVVEYLYDNRGDQASTPFQKDITTALRFVLNDAQSTQVLFGITTDIDNQAVASFLEASRRLSDSFKLEVELRTFSNTETGQILNSFRQDDFLQIELAWYF